MLDLSNAPMDLYGELAHRMGIEFIQADADSVVLRMPVEGNRQGAKILHGGANGVLVEHAGSILAVFNAPAGRVPVGSELNVSQLRPAHKGYVTARATLISRARSSICTSVEVRDDTGELTAIGRLSLVYIPIEKLNISAEELTAHSL